MTLLSVTTEAPDETAHGEWMKIMATAGLEVDKAFLQYLVDGDHEVDRNGSTFWRGVRLSMNRPRPPKSEQERDKDEKTQPSR